MKVGIVGAGITGLTVGFKLKQAGVDVTLYEASAHAGGPIQTHRENGYLAEHGPNSILETSPAISDLVRELDLESRKIYAGPQAKNRYVVRDGNLVPLPTSPQSFASTKLFSLRAKLALLREPFIPRAQHDESLADFVRRRLGQEFLDYAINPFVAGIYAGDPERLSTEHAFPKLFAIEQKYGSLIKGQFRARRERSAETSKQKARMFSFDEGLGVLIQSLEQRLGDSIKRNAPVAKVSRREQWEVIDAAGNSDTFDSVILTAPAYTLARLSLPTTDLSPLAEILYPPVTSLVLGFRQSDVSHSLDGFGMLIPAVERCNILGTLFSSSLFPHRAPEGFVTLTTYVGGMRQPENALLSDDALLLTVLRDLQTLLGVRSEPTFIHRSTFERAIPQYTLGYEKYKRLMDDAEVKNPGLYLVGNFRNGISVGDSIKAATMLAERIKL